MIDGEAFIKNSPFQIIHGGDSNLKYNLNNTTPDLLKFQLQEQHRNKLSEFQDNQHKLPNLNLLYNKFLQGSLNNHLQTNLDQENISLQVEVPSLSSTPNTDNEDELNVCNEESKANYINLRVLIENSVFDTSKVNSDAILPLPKLNKLKQEIEDKKELKEYLQSKYGISQQFFSTVIMNSEKQEELELDTPLLLKFMKLNNYLQRQLQQVSEDLSKLESQVNYHNMACLLLGYIEDIKMSSLPSPNTPLYNSSPLASPTKLSKSSSLSFEEPMQLIRKPFESLFSHIASIAVQRNIQLPQPPPSTNPESIQSRIQWAQDCIDKILSVSPTPRERVNENDRSINLSADEIPSRNEFSQEHSFLNETSITSVSPQKSQANDKIIAEYKTALNDLRFSHEYLTKEYEHSRESSLKIIQEYRKKNAIIEKELIKLKKYALSNQVNRASDGYDSIEAKDREILKLRKELNFSKIDKLGIKSGIPRFASPSNSNGGLSTLSPITSNFVSDHDETDGNEIEAMPSRPTSISSSSTSNGILRTEFKKIVLDIHDQYELQLNEERIRRRQLQDKLQTLENEK